MRVRTGNSLFYSIGDEDSIPREWFGLPQRFVGTYRLGKANRGGGGCAKDANSPYWVTWASYRPWTIHRHLAGAPFLCTSQCIFVCTLSLVVLLFFSKHSHRSSLVHCIRIACRRFCLPMFVFCLCTLGRSLVLTLPFLYIGVALPSFAHQQSIGRPACPTII